MPLRAPVAVGAKRTRAVQAAPAAMVSPMQFSPLTTKSSESLRTEVTFSGAAPVFVSVTAVAGPIVPTVWLPSAPEPAVPIAARLVLR